MVDTSLTPSIRTSAGKLDRRRLRQTVEQASKDELALYKLSAMARAAKRREPASKMEKKLQSLWEAILGLPQGSVRAEDNFFGVGGDSLTAMRLVGAARAHRIVLSVLDIFEHPVLTDMARACGGLEVETTGDPIETAPPPFSLLACPKSEFDGILREVSSLCLAPLHHIQDLYPCSPLQEGLVALASKQAGAYVAVSTLELPGNVDVDRFKAAWQAVVDETDTLRTRIVHTSSSGFLQAVFAPEPIDWHDELSVEEAAAKGKTLGSQNGGPLVRFAFVRREGARDYFVWSIHHALYDGWSLPRISRRVQDIYHNVSQPNHDHTKSRPPYASFIRYLASRDVSESEKFWADVLAGSSSVTPFPEPPTVVNRGKKPKFGLATTRVKIDRSKFLADITIPTLVRAAWVIILAAYTGTEDVVFGETLAGRNIDLAGVEDIAGPTIATVPVRAQPLRHIKLAEFLQTIQKMASRMVRHQHLGLQHIRRLSSDCAAACDFQNILTIQASTGSQNNRGDDWDFQGGASTESFFANPLVLECNVTDTTIEANFHHDETVLSAWHARRLVHQLESVLKQLLERSRDKKATLADIHAISPEDHTLIAQWNRLNTFEGKVEMEVDSCIHQLFLEQASTCPDRPAISAWDAELTYNEVRDYASRLAFRLGQLGVSQGTLIPVCLTRSAWAIITLLGVLMAGGAFVPFDPAHPLARQKDMLETLAPSLMVCSPENKPRFEGIVETCLSVDGNMIRDLPAPPQGVLNAARYDPSSTAYVLFTSGSTGKPKGVAAAHRDFTSSSLGYARATRMDASSRVFHFASLTFDVALMEVLTPLTLGACTCVPSEDERLHAPGAAIARLRATWAFLTPSVANLIDPRAVCPVPLKTLVCGGEAMLTETVARWADHVELMNGYGPTEACVLAVVNPAVSAERDRTIIGRATAAGRAWVVEARGQHDDWLAPVGAIGELAISGPLLARGYLNDPERTARVFVENPAWGRDHAGTGVAAPARIYRTGDLVRYRPDGAIEFIGRKDGQVKVNGQRIELGEVESWLSADSAVRLALVVQPKSGPYQKQLVGVITLVAGGGTDVGGNNDCTPVDGSPERLTRIRADVAGVRGRLADALPHYMVPSVFIVLKNMPVGVSGKLDRQKVMKWLQSLDDTTYQRITNILGDESEQEVELTGPAKTLREIWAQELRITVDRVKSNQPFLSLGRLNMFFLSQQMGLLTPTDITGGDSIRAMGIVSRARNAQLIVSLQDVLRCKSVIHLAQLAKQAPSAGAIQANASEEDEELFPPSPIQKLYLQLADNHDGDARFNQSFALKAPQGTTVDAIKRAMDSIVQRHAMLRARFVKGQDDGWRLQTIKVRSSIEDPKTLRLQNLLTVGGTDGPFGLRLQR